MKNWLKRRCWRTRIFLAIWTVLGLAILVSYVQTHRDPPPVSVAQTLPETHSADTAPLAITWPRQGSAAVGIAGAGIVDATKNDPQRSIASLVKVMTAYVVLKDHPLKPGEIGETITVGKSDVDFYRSQISRGESVVAVREGTEFSERNLLEGLLIPSGNNLSYLLANWNSGSVEAFVERMNQEAAALGMKDTRYVEPSGAHPANVSTARDQLLLVEAAMANIEFARIVGMKQADLPTAGVVYNVNSRLGQDGIVGVKTGWTEEAGACFVFAADQMVGDHKVRIYGAVLGQDTLDEAFAATRGLIGSVGQGVQVVTLVTKGAPAGTVKSDWGESIDAVSDRDLNVVVWSGVQVEIQVRKSASTNEVKAGDEVAKLVVKAGPQSQEATLIAGSAMSKAGLEWRLTRTLP